MMMSEWIKAIAADQCSPGSAIEIVVGERIVALFNVDGQFHALDGVCPHQGGPLGKGDLTGCTVTCPWHGWQFDVRTGQNSISQNVKQPYFECKEEGGFLWIKMAADA